MSGFEDVYVVPDLRERNGVRVVVRVKVKVRIGVRIRGSRVWRRESRV